MGAAPLLYAAVGAGAALGSVARHVCGFGLHHLLGAGFAWGTLGVNGTGSFLIGLCAALIEPGRRFALGPVARQFIITGFCGGFTTFSIFSLETLLFLEDGKPILALVNVLGSAAVWLVAVAAGYRLGARIDAAAQGVSP